VLLSEAEWGKWPLEFSRDLADRVHQTEAAEQWQPLEIPAEVAATASSESLPPAAEGTQRDRLLQRHDHEHTLQGTHTDSTPRYAETIYCDSSSKFEND